MQEVSKQAVFKSPTKTVRPRRKCVTKSSSMMDLRGGHGRATGPLLQPMGQRKMSHFSYVVGVACWEVLALGHGARGSEIQFQMVSINQ